MGGSSPSKYENAETYEQVQQLGLNFLLIKSNLSSCRRIRFVCISDTHNNHSYIDIPNGDVLIHAGDITTYNKGGSKEIELFNTWLGTLPHEHKIIIGGNHDYCLSKHKYETCQKKILTNGTYLIDSSVTIYGIKIYGSPWHRYRGLFYFSSAFGLSEQKLKEKWEEIPDDTDILITHVPPFGILDSGIGSYHLLNNVINRVLPKVHIFGHCHDQPGIKKLKISKQNMDNPILTLVKKKKCPAGSITFINASQAYGEPIVFDYEIGNK